MIDTAAIEIAQKVAVMMAAAVTAKADNDNL
jgi:hypothetical protein